ncbi:MAG: IS1380 family transposase [Micromonosporaceae bacterium]|nr:IS1380 family transposase [Micromonosporaceae bacterium]
MGAASHTLDRVEVTFDGDRMVADAGLILPATLSQHLGVEALVDELVSVGHRPGRKLLTVVHALLAGGDCIDDADILRSGATSEVVGHEVMAPSTIGTWLRSFTFGHVRQLDALTERLLTAAWAAGAGPGAAPLVIDVDSTICQTHGYAKQGATYGYTRQRGYHPLLATRADTGEILHARMRKGSANSSRGAQRFVRETIRRVRRAGATGPIVLRADSAFWSAKVITACRDHNVRFSITVRATKAVVAAIDGIDETAWVDIDYTDGGVAQVAETTLAGRRLIVRRTRLVGAQAQLWPDWRHHAFITDLDGDAVAVDADHRAHAVVELAIRDLKAGAGLTHCPSGRFNANAAWLVLTALAHNLLRWVASLGLRLSGLVVAKTIRRRYLSLPGRMTHSGRVDTLHLPTRWPWRDALLAALVRLRALPPPG